MLFDELLNQSVILLPAGAAEHQWPMVEYMVQTIPAMNGKQLALRAIMNVSVTTIA
jgi:hypothetical protein